MKYYTKTFMGVYKRTEFFIEEEFKILLELGMIVEEKRVIDGVLQVDYYTEDGEWAGYSVATTYLTPAFMERWFPHLL
jgi:hypothetical protein